MSKQINVSFAYHMNNHIPLGTVDGTTMVDILDAISEYAQNDRSCILTMNAKLTRDAGLVLDNVSFAGCACGTRGTIKTCAKNFCTGKCRDEFMRRTFGTAMYPEFYIKGKAR